MANGDLESFRCPAETLQCAAKRIDFTFMEVLQHVLYHIIFEIFKSEKEAYKDGLNEILDDNVIEAGVEKLEIQEMDSSLVNRKIKIKLQDSINKQLHIYKNDRTSFNKEFR